MKHWNKRTNEEKALLNPGFTAVLIWCAARGYLKSNVSGLSFEESFLVLPIILDTKLRSTLPSRIDSSIIKWLDENPLTRNRITTQAKLLLGYTREALLFGGTHQLLCIRNCRVLPNEGFTKLQTLRSQHSTEVNHCLTKADFLGRWLAQVNDPATVFASLGAKP